MQKISKWGKICSAVAFPKPGFLYFPEQWLQCFCWFVYKINQFVKFSNIFSWFLPQGKHVNRVNMSGLLQTRIEKHWSRAVFSSPVHQKLPDMLTFLSQSCRFCPFLLFSAPFVSSLLKLLLLDFRNCDVSTHISSSGDSSEYLVLDSSFLIPFVV